MTLLNILSPSRLPNAAPATARPQAPDAVRHAPLADQLTGQSGTCTDGISLDTQGDKYLKNPPEGDRASTTCKTTRPPTTCFDPTETARIRTVAPLRPDSRSPSGRTFSGPAATSPPCDQPYRTPAPNDRQRLPLFQTTGPFQAQDTERQSQDHAVPSDRSADRSTLADQPGPAVPHCDRASPDTAADHADRYSPSATRCSTSAVPGHHSRPSEHRQGDRLFTAEPRSASSSPARSPAPPIQVTADVHRSLSPTPHQDNWVPGTRQRSASPRVITSTSPSAAPALRPGHSADSLSFFAGLALL